MNGYVLIENDYRKYLWRTIWALVQDITDDHERCLFINFLTTLFKNINDPQVGDELLRGESSQLSKDHFLPILRRTWPSDDWSDANYTRARDRLRKLKASSQHERPPSKITGGASSSHSAGSRDSIGANRTSIVRTKQ